MGNNKSKEPVHIELGAQWYHGDDTITGVVRMVRCTCTYACMTLCSSFAETDPSLFFSIIHVYGIARTFKNQGGTHATPLTSAFKAPKTRVLCTQLALVTIGRPTTHVRAGKVKARFFFFIDFENICRYSRVYILLCIL